jgi:hypothetical protein
MALVGITYYGLLFWGACVLRCFFNSPLPENAGPCGETHPTHRILDNVPVVALSVLNRGNCEGVL